VSRQGQQKSPTVETVRLNILAAIHRRMDEGAKEEPSAPPNHLMTQLPKER